MGDIEYISVFVRVNFIGCSLVIIKLRYQGFLEQKLGGFILVCDYRFQNQL